VATDTPTAPNPTEPNPNTFDADRLIHRITQADVLTAAEFGERLKGSKPDQPVVEGWSLEETLRVVEESEKRARNVKYPLTAHPLVLRFSVAEDWTDPTRVDNLNRLLNYCSFVLAGEARKKVNEKLGVSLDLDYQIIFNQHDEVFRASGVAPTHFVPTVNGQTIHIPVVVFGAGLDPKMGKWTVLRYGRLVLRMTRGSLLAAGFDLPMTSIETIDTVASVVICNTGVGIEPPGLIHVWSGHHVQVMSRSGLAAKHGIAVCNAPGIIDLDYQGEIKAILSVPRGCFEAFTFPMADYSIRRILTPGTRVAQVVGSTPGVLRYSEVDVMDANGGFPGAARGVGGFGSTGA
jgi:dUTP pyrophosphatase